MFKRILVNGIRTNTPLPKKPGVSLVGILPNSLKLSDDKKYLNEFCFLFSWKRRSGLVGLFLGFKRY